MKSGSSAPIGSGAQAAGWLAEISWCQTSRPDFIGTPAPVWRTTMTVSTLSHFSSASSTFAFKGTLRPPRRPSSAVITMRHFESSMRWARLSGEKPPKTME